MAGSSFTEKHTRTYLDMNKGLKERKREKKGKVGKKLA